ncbi:TPM domain-containing protein [Fervidibacillus halotolerans]|uniref:TPM domain-containing protein n=1 Tax=Fervidibacillus halotolerans TaxID=2980027 RepID=A0A9E8M1R9_9BACI|nr:TPM domain-containing protein [Fervidibacillus halotolerans]WAA12851.1 TPM domain-containing protein [Fervidibacillus halotolerans]
MRKKSFLIYTFLFSLFISFLFAHPAFAIEQRIYDDAGILSDAEKEELESYAQSVSEKWDTDVLIVTVDDPTIDVKDYTEDFYDRKIEELGLDKWNVAMITLDMNHREVYLAGFYKGELYLNGSRLDHIRESITPDLSAGAYSLAFQQFIDQVDHYLGSEPANIFLQWWFQLIIAVVIGGLVVFSLFWQSGGKSTVHSSTYMDHKTSRVVARKDDYLRTTVTKVRKPQNNQSSGGGGITGGGHSHSGSRGSF